MVDSEGSGQPDASEVPDELKTAIGEFLPKAGTGDDGVEREPYEAVAGYIQKLLAERGEGHNEIDTQSGERITPLAPDREKINLEDIAHGLSNVGRFAGQGKEFYSVARHSVYVSYEVDARGASREAQRYALVHDAAEAYLSDVPGPVKKSLPGYKHAEKHLDETIADALGLEITDVKEADEAVNSHELWVHFPDGDHQEPDNLHHDPDAVDTGEDDKAVFLQRARELGL